MANAVKIAIIFWNTSLIVHVIAKPEITVPFLMMKAARLKKVKPLCISRGSFCKDWGN